MRLQNANRHIYNVCLVKYNLKEISNILHDTLRLSSQLQDLITEEIVRHKETYDPACTRDFIDEYLGKIEEIESQEKRNIYNGQSCISIVTLHQLQLLQCCFCLESMLMFILRDFLIAGVETVATTMTWTILILANRPNVQEKVVDTEYS